MIDKENITLEYLNEKYPSPVSIDKTEKILKQMKECVCRIFNNEKKGTGFFTKIYDRSFLITNNHVLNKDDIINNGEIKYSFGQEKNLRSINCNLETREIYESKDIDLDFTIIEIKEQDKINKNNFLEIDNVEESESFSNHPIYILGYPNIENQDDKIYVSYGIMKCIKNSLILHLSNTINGSSGSPILSLKSGKIIGYHRGFLRKEEINVGSFIGDVQDIIFQKTKKLLAKNNQNLKKLIITYIIHLSYYLTI